MVGRPREFNIDKTVADACNAFWANGIHATSMSDVCAATGLSTGSIYKAFGSKEGLVHAALDDYLSNQQAKFEAMFEESNPIDAIRLLMEYIVAAASSPTAQRGCFSVTGALELGGSDPAATDRLTAHSAVTHELLANAIEAAAALGQVHNVRQPDGASTQGSSDTAKSADEIAANLWLTIAGLQLSARVGVTEDQAVALLDTSLQLALGIPLRP